MTILRRLSTLSALILMATISFGQPGSLDGDFDADGKLTTAIGTADDFCYAVAVQPDGKILAVGYSMNANDPDFAIIRYNIDGTLDNSFDANGIAIVDLGDWEEATSVALQPDGKIVVAGYAFTGANFEFAILRYNVDGSLDNTFASNGILTTDVGNGDDLAQSVAIQSDGKIVVSGGSDGGPSGDFAAARYNTDGSLDNTFGVGGVAITELGLGNAVSYGMGIQSDGKIVLSGALNNGTDLDFATIRYNTDGSLDLTFSVDGIVQTAIGSGTEIAYETLIQDDGKILAVGFSVNGVDADVALVRYNEDGSLDTSFDLDGKTIYDSGTGDDGAYGAALQVDGKIVVVGSQDGGAEPDFALLRYDMDGTLDSTFGADGLVITDFGLYAAARGVAMDPDGKIVVGGSVTDAGNDDFAVARYNSGLNIGIADLQFEANSVLVYPNPIQDVAILEYTLLEDQQLNIELIDISGRSLGPILPATKRAAGFHQESLDLVGIPSGNYILKMSGSGGSFDVQVVKK